MAEYSNPPVKDTATEPTSKSETKASTMAGHKYAHIGIAGIGKHPADMAFACKVMRLEKPIIKQFFDQMRLRGWLFDNGLIETMWMATQDPDHVWRAEELDDEPCQFEFALRLQQCRAQGKQWRDRAKNFRAGDLRIDYSSLIAKEDIERSVLERKSGLRAGALGRPKADVEAKLDEERRQAYENVLQEVIQGHENKLKTEADTIEMLTETHLGGEKLRKKNFDEGPEGGSDDDFEDDEDEGDDWEDEEVREESRTKVDLNKGYFEAGNLKD